MKSIVYLSQAKISFSDEALEELTRLSSENNDSLGISGYLCYQNGRFLQYLEGPIEPVDALVEKIKKDPRHEFLYYMEGGTSAKKLFPFWSMRRISDSDLSYLNMEHHVETNLLYLKENFSNKSVCTDLVWRQIENIAKYGGRL